MNFKEKKSGYKKGDRNVGAQAVSQINKRDIIKNIIEIYFKEGKYPEGITF
jgi:hypothetical protein